MHRILLLAVAASALVLALASCNSSGARLREYPTTAAALDDKTRQKIQRGIVEPGYTPEMVYLALGKPTTPANGLADATRDGMWVYRDFHRNDRDFVKAGFRRRVVFDPVRRSDTIVTEPVDPKLYPALAPHSVQITFKDGRVVEVQRVAEIF